LRANWERLLEVFKSRASVPLVEAQEFRRMVVERLQPLMAHLHDYAEGVRVVVTASSLACSKGSSGREPPVPLSGGVLSGSPPLRRLRVGSRGYPDDELRGRIL